jgi:hypothetical protein
MRATPNRLRNGWVGCCRVGVQRAAAAGRVCQGGREYLA